MLIKQEHEYVDQQDERNNKNQKGREKNQLIEIQSKGSVSLVIPTSFAWDMGT